MLTVVLVCAYINVRKQLEGDLMSSSRRPSLVQDELARLIAQSSSASQPSPSGGVLSLGGGLPASELLPLKETFAAANADLSSGVLTQDALQYGWPEGDLVLRKWVADRLKARGDATDPDDIIITDGAQQALSLVSNLLPEGTRIAVDELIYPMAKKALLEAGHVLVHPNEQAEMWYLMDGVSNPDGIDHVGPRRDALLTYGRDLIVDEAYVDLRFDGKVPRPLCADAVNRVWHIGSVSKVVGPGFRVGWLIPPENRRKDVIAHRSVDHLQTGSLAQAMLACWLRHNDYDNQVCRARKLYSERAAHLTGLLRSKDELRGWQFKSPEGGLTLWVETDLEGDEVEFMEHAYKYGIGVDPGSIYRPFRLVSRHIELRLGFSNLSFSQLNDAVGRLADAVRNFKP